MRGDCFRFDAVNNLICILPREHLEIGPKAVDLLVLHSLRPEMVVLGSGTRVAYRHQEIIDV